MTLLEECIVALGKDAKVLDGDEDVFARKKFDENIPLTLWCAFDYDKIKGKKEKCDITELANYLNSNKYYIFWDDATTQALLCSTKALLDNIDDVTAVSTNTWLMSEDFKCFIQIHSGYETTVVTL